MFLRNIKLSFLLMPSIYAVSFSNADSSSDEHKQWPRTSVVLAEIHDDSIINSGKVIMKQPVMKPVCNETAFIPPTEATSGNSNAPSHIISMPTSESLSEIQSTTFALSEQPLRNKGESKIEEYPLLENANTRASQESATRSHINQDPNKEHAVKPADCTVCCERLAEMCCFCLQMVVFCLD